jgi:DNA polymerase-3 subunit delta
VKFAGAAAQRALSGGPPPRFVLVSGPDAGLVRRLADRVAQTWSAANADLTARRYNGDDLKAGPDRLVEAIGAASLFGGATLARVRIDGEREGGVLARIVADFADHPPEGAMVVESDELARGSKLKKAFEDATHAWSLQLYAPARQDLERAGEEAAAALAAHFAPGVLSDLLEAAAQDVDTVAGEATKLALYVGPGGVIDAAALDALGSASREAGVDEAVGAAFSGATVDTIAQLQRAAAGGASPVVILNGVARRIRLLLNVISTCEHGGSPSEAVKNPRLGVHFMRQGEVAAQAARWRRARLEDVLSATIAADQSVKRQGAPANEIVERLLIRIANHAAAR